jgi:GNAT superfamily N-acetyltransferase
VTELGFPPYDDPGKVWFVALADDQVAGFVGLRPEVHAWVFCSDYVRPEYRRQGLYKQLMAERLSYAQGRADSAIAVVSLAARHCYEQHGFTLSPQPKQRLKRYVEMRRSLR